MNEFQKEFDTKSELQTVIFSTINIYLIRFIILIHMTILIDWQS